MLKETFIKLSVFLNENDEFTNTDAIDILFAYANNQRMNELSQHVENLRFQTFCDFAFDEATTEFHSKIFDKVFLDKELDSEDEQCLFAHIEN